MAMTSSCALCGDAIVPASPPALCAPCSALVEEPESVRRVRRLDAVPTAELLRRLDGTVRGAVDAAARDALARLSSERIYGFVLLHYIFGGANAAVLTEAQFERSVPGREARSPDDRGRTYDRWSPADSGHHMYREDLFGPTADLFMALERRGQEAEVARIFIRAMRHVRANIFTDPGVVLSVMDYSDGPGVPFYAYAELFNDSVALARLRADLWPGPHWDYLDLERSRIPED